MRKFFRKIVSLFKREQEQVYVPEPLDPIEYGLGFYFTDKDGNLCFQSSLFAQMYGVESPVVIEYANPPKPTRKTYPPKSYASALTKDN